MYRYHKSCIPVTWVRVETAPYVALHGTEPGGCGLWMFELAGETAMWFGSYAEARDKAVARAACRGIGEVTLCG